MDDSPRRSVNRQLLIDVMLKVSSLTDGSGGWNNDLLVELFPPNEVHRIQQMRQGLAEDCYIWAYSRQRAYTVKTGYEILVREKVLQAGQISQQEQVRNNLKKKIWKMPTLPKVRMFCGGLYLELLQSLSVLIIEDWEWIRLANYVTMVWKQSITSCFNAPQLPIHGLTQESLSRWSLCNSLWRKILHSCLI